MAVISNSAIAADLAVAGKKAKYDSYIKNILSNKSILAWILKFTTDEFRDFDIVDIVECIENPEIGSAAVNPGYGSYEKVIGLKNEDKVPNEGEVVYDIRFNVYKPVNSYDKENVPKENIKLIINVEAQKNFYPGYNIVARAIFYCARLLSAQMGTEFTAKNYDDIKKVYSIWICMDTNRESENTITSYEIQPRSIYGDVKNFQGCDLLRAVMVCLGNNVEGCYNEEKDGGAILLNLLSTIVNDKIQVSEKLRILKEEYSIETTKGIREEMADMCNLSDAIEQRGIELGMQHGIQRGEAVKLCELVDGYVKRNAVTVEKACDMMGVSVSEYNDAKKLLDIGM